jgi:acetylglutamate kinase
VKREGARVRAAIKDSNSRDGGGAAAHRFARLPQKLLVKIGGTLLDADAAREGLARQIADAARTAAVVVVHGGGRQMTRFLAERGVESRFVNGLRVTTPAVLDAVVKVVAGSVNRQLVAALNRAGARAVGISGIDAGLVEAVQMDLALGSVGRVTRADPALLDTLVAGGFLPVVACVAGDREGRLYNVNADQMAAACAVAFGADQLIFFTDVAGVLDAGQRVLPRLTRAQGEALMAAGIATGGMLAKLNAAHSALGQGVPQVRICAGAAEGILQRILAGEDAGTRLAVEEVCAG